MAWDTDVRYKRNQCTLTILVYSDRSVVSVSSVLFLALDPDRPVTRLGSGRKRTTEVMYERVNTCPMDSDTEWGGLNMTLL